MSVELIRFHSVLFLRKLLCEEAAGLRFSPVVYPKVSLAPSGRHLALIPSHP